MATRSKRKDWVPPPGAVADTGEVEVEETKNESPEYLITLPKEQVTAIKMHQWEKAWNLGGKGRATLGKPKAKKNDLGPINGVLEWDYPCPMCGTRAFVNRRDALVCIGCRTGYGGNAETE